MESEKIPGFGAYILALFLTPIYCLTRGKWVGFILSTLLYIAAGLTIFMFGLGLIPWALAALPAAFSLRNEILEAHARRTGEATAKAIAAVMPVKTEGHLPQHANIAQQAAKAPPPPESTLTPAGDKICPMCAETVKAAARICKHCKHEFDLGEQSKVAAVGTVGATSP